MLLSSVKISLAPSAVLLACLICWCPLLGGEFFLMSFPFYFSGFTWANQIDSSCSTRIEIYGTQGWLVGILGLSRLAVFLQMFRYQPSNIFCAMLVRLVVKVCRKTTKLKNSTVLMEIWWLGGGAPNTREAPGNHFIFVMLLSLTLYPWRRIPCSRQGPLRQPSKDLGYSFQKCPKQLAKM